MSVSWIENQPIPHAVVSDDDRLSKEVMVFCPYCKCFETIWFTRGILDNTHKKIYTIRQPYIPRLRF